MTDYEFFASLQSIFFSILPFFLPVISLRRLCVDRPHVEQKVINKLMC